MNANRLQLIKRMAKHRGQPDMSEKDAQAVCRRLEAVYLNSVLDGQPPFGKEGVQIHDGEAQSDRGEADTRTDKAG